jgi:hypothetical protein
MLMRTQRIDRLGDFDPGESLVTSAFSQGISAGVEAAAGFVIPGIGLLIGFALSRLMSESDDRSTQIHFNNNVIGPVVRAAKAKDFDSAIGLITDAPAATEHIGYTFGRARGAMPALYAEAVGNALAHLNPGRLMQFAALLDMLQAHATAQKADIPAPDPRLGQPGTVTDEDGNVHTGIYELSEEGVVVLKITHTQGEG